VRPSWHHGAAALVLLAVAATLAGCARPAPRAPQPAAEAFRRPEVRPGDAIVVPLDVDRVPALAMWQSSTSIIYNLAVAVAAIGAL